MDDADWAADMAEREREALIAAHRRRLPPPRPRDGPEPFLLEGAPEAVADARDLAERDARASRR
jgi:hypothetical protein